MSAQPSSPKLPRSDTPNAARREPRAVSVAHVDAGWRETHREACGADRRVGPGGHQCPIFQFTLNQHTPPCDRVSRRCP
jgi:hypothetical protein